MSQKINVDIITEYKGRQNLKSAEKDMNVLGNAAKELAKTFAKVFAVEKIIEFGKASVEAFAADEKSAKILSNTLGNLGIAFDNVPVEGFITKLSELNGIAKTDLRTSFDTLVRSTGDATKAQDLLSLGLDISKGTGKELSAVTLALSKAYGGNFAAISRLGAGVTKAEIATGNFAAIQAHLASVFKGDAATAAETFSGKLARLKTSFEEFKITIGSGLVDAFTTLTKGGDLTAFQEIMHNVAMDVADMVRGIGIFGGDIASIVSKVNSISGGLVGKILGFSLKNSIVGALIGAGSDARAKAALNGAVGSTLGEYQNNAANNARAAATKKAAADAAKVAKDALAAQAKITAEKNKQLAADKAALGLKLAGQTTDMQNIEIQAALQRGQTAQTTNVLLLQRAQITGNADQAIILSQEILKSQGLVMDVSGNISSLASAKNPFADWPTATEAAKAQLKAIQDALALIKDKQITITVNTVSTGSNGVGGAGSGGSGGTVVDPISPFMPLITTPIAPLPSYASPSNNGISTVLDYLNGLGKSYAGTASNGVSTIGDYNNAQMNITVQLNNQAIAGAITSTQVDNSASGIPNSFQRSGFGSGALPW